MPDDAGSRRIFSLEEAQALLPDVRASTAEAARRAEALSERLQDLDEGDPRRESLAGELNEVVADWASRIRALGLEVKGIWLVDFDNGEGYYCWAWPEESIGHFHGYDEGFAGRMKIV